MSRLHGKSGDVTIAAGSIAGIKSWSVTYTVDTAESTAFDSAGVKAYLPGGSGWSGSFEGNKDAAPITIGTEVALVLKESAAGTQKFNGQAIITSLAAKTDIAGLVTYSYNFQGTAGLTIPTT